MRKLLFLIIFLQLAVAACAPLPRTPDDKQNLAYLGRTDDQTLLAGHLPIFIVEQPDKPYNKIGTPKAVITEEGRERIHVDPEQPTVYAEERKFATAGNSYTNLIYRVHFRETPYGLFPFQLGAGENVGLLVIVTLNASGQPVLYTTVHTCGCYLAFIPTTYLPETAYPPGWPKNNQVVYAEILPSRLDPQNEHLKSPALALWIRDASHRIKDISLTDKTTFNSFAIAPIRIQPLPLLEKLSLGDGGGTTSFYETSGPRTGYVKGSRKPFERFLMGWWALDWKVGEDKKLGRDKSEPPVFYTSLKPWARNESDLRDFAAFLNYWGWKL